MLDHNFVQRPARVPADGGQHSTTVLVCINIYVSSTILRLSQGMLMTLFSIPGARKPNHVFYDSNCNTLRELLAMQRRGTLEEKTICEWFADVGLPVDVFHHRTKHNDTDELCKYYCNPAAYPELMTQDKKWYFNSSAAEQVNAWFGKFHAICREMSAVHFNFFLDEMILQRNITTVKKLQREGLTIGRSA